MPDPDAAVYAYVKNSPILLRGPLGLVVTCGPIASRPGGWKARGDSFWRFTGNTEGPGSSWPFAPLTCYWDLVAPGWDITINFRICSDSCRKVDWIEEVSRTETPHEEILVKNRAVFARPYLLPRPYGAGSGRVMCDPPW
jgi:hypothetical protein